MSQLQSHHVVQRPTDSGASWWKNVLELFSRAEKRIADVILLGFGFFCVCVCARVRGVVSFDARVKPWVRQSCFTSEEGNWTSLLCASHSVRFAPGLISHVEASSQLAIWNRKKQWCSDSWLPAKEDGGVDKVVILKIYIYFYFSSFSCVFLFVYFANISGARHTFHCRFQSSAIFFLLF